MNAWLIILSAIVLLIVILGVLAWRYLPPERDLIDPQVPDEQDPHDDGPDLADLVDGDPEDFRDCPRCQGVKGDSDCPLCRGWGVQVRRSALERTRIDPPLPRDWDRGFEDDPDPDEEWALQLRQIGSDLRAEQEQAERLATRTDVFTRVWEDMDGLEKEMLMCWDARRREEQLWEELKAETHELCRAYATAA